jgi:hypothetical protein
MTTIDQHGDAHDVSGQYATKTQSEPEVHLGQPASEGTFLFPPASYESVAQYTDFWANAPISDGVLSNITAGYADLIRRQANLLSVDWGHKYDAEHSRELHHGSKASMDAARKHREDAYLDHLAGWYISHPPKVKAGTARTVARAAQTVYFSSAFSDPNDRAEIQSSTMDLAGEILSVRDIVARYQMDKLRDYFQDPDVTTAERLEDLRIELQRMVASQPR